MFLDAVLTNYKSIGAQVHSTKLEAGRAEAVISGFPNEALCAELDADCSLAEAYHDVAAPVAERLGLTWWWGSSGELTTLVVTAGVTRRWPRSSASRMSPSPWTIRSR
ncbi:MAG: hypothetical protein R2848_07295 [Thermomicrobiales bacterium]